MGDEVFERRITELVAGWGGGASPELIAELIATALRMGRDPVPTADLKLYNRALRELRQASKAFAPYRDVRKVVVFGSARTAETAEEYQAAEAFARRMRDEGFMIITGGGDGIMGAAQKGAGREGGFGLNIRLPFEQRANETIDGDPKLVNFNYFFTRKLTFLKETHAVALFPGGFGTMDEGFEALTLMQTGKSHIFPLVLVDRPGGTYWHTWHKFIGEYLLGLGLVSRDDFHLYKIAGSVEDAVREITGFYRTYHSSRWVGDRLVIRLRRALAEGVPAILSRDFEDVLREGAIIQTEPLPEESGEHPALARLVLRPHRHNFGRLRLLIDRINGAPTAE
jgi:uncharacterized protein (TIGR00730 family)